MALTVGIIGLPNVGKSTFLNMLADAGAEASNYAFCTIDRNQGVVAVPDERLAKLEEILKPKEVIPSTITYIDIAGLVKGASRGEGLGNKFLHHIREAHVLAHVLRCFEDENVGHVYGGIDPLRDYEIVETELFMADLDRVEKWLEKERTKAKAKKKGERKELEYLETLHRSLSRGEKIDREEASTLERKLLDELRLLTMKPFMVVLNMGEDEEVQRNDAYRTISEKFGGDRIFTVSAKLEAEIEAMGEEDRADFIRELGIDAESRNRFIEKCHELLGLIRYYTTAHDKLQAWSIEGGTTAPRAAGKIHTDMENGFIKAEVVSFDDLIRFGSKAEVQHHGVLKTEGHDYVVQDGDIIHFLFQR
jgi:GTP-binding protein YchF